MSRAGTGGELSPDPNDPMQQRIDLARRDAATLKERIKNRKDNLADASCEFETASGF